MTIFTIHDVMFFNSPLKKWNISERIALICGYLELLNVFFSSSSGDTSSWGSNLRPSKSLFHFSCTSQWLLPCSRWPTLAEQPTLTSHFTGKYSSEQLRPIVSFQRVLIGDWQVENDAVLLAGSIHFALSKQSVHDNCMPLGASF